MPSAAVRKRAERVVSLTSDLIMPAVCRPSRVRMNMARGLPVCGMATRT